MIYRFVAFFLLTVPMLGQAARRAPAAPAQPAPPAASSPIIMFTSWREPRENAFTINVPEGWHVSGATVRDSAMDPRHTLRAFSPDRSIEILIGDSGMIPRQVPNPYVGAREGQIIRGAWGGPLMIARYETGEQFAQTYIREALCRQAKITSSHVIEDATRKLNQEAVEYGRAMGAVAQAWVGEATYQCSGQNGYQEGYIRASTVVAGPPSGGLQVWAILELSGYIVTDASQAVMARYALNNMVSSFQLDPQWEAKQAQLTQDTTGRITRAQQEMAARIAQHARQEARGNQIDVMSNWEKNSKIHDAVMDRDTQARRGVMTADDPSFGSRTVSNQYNYVWTRPDGSMIGTNTTTPPDYNSGWRMMQTH